MGSFSEYFETAMQLAEYEAMEDNEGWFGTIPGFSGLWASAPTEAECRVELRATLEDWVLFSLQRQVPVPALRDIDLNLRPSEAA
jgi:predicted RNase H-like HicB family nuclease